MADTPITITLSEESSALLRARMTWADHPTAESLLEDALAVMFENQGPPLEQMDLDEIREVCEEYDRDPTQVVTEAQLDLSLAEVFRQERELFLKAG